MSENLWRAAWARLIVSSLVLCFAMACERVNPRGVARARRRESRPKMGLACGALPWSRCTRGRSWSRTPPRR